MNRPKLRVAVLVDANSVPEWHAEAVSAIGRSDCAKLSLVIKCKTSDHNTTKPAEFSWFRKIEEFEEGRAQLAANACRRRATRSLAPETECLVLPENVLSDTLSLPGKLVEQLRTHNLDVIVSLNSRTLCRALSSACNIGALYYSHGYGQADIVDGSTVGLWEVLRRAGTIYSALNFCPPGEGANRVVYESRSGVFHTSFITGRNEHLWKITAFVPRVLRELNDSADALSPRRLSDLGEPAPVTSPSSTLQATNLNLATPLLRYVAWRVALKFINKVRFERWILMFGMGSENQPFKELTKLMPPDGQFWADPYIVQKDDGYHVFFEEADLSTWKGRIAAMQISNSGECGQPRTIIERDYHLSYPFILEWRGETYMIPESAENKTIEVYQCMDFPYEWKFSHILMKDISAYDATLIEWDGTWWMFVNVKEHAGASSWDELHLFYADTPLDTEWTPHPMNPVISDVCNARPAGRLFVRSGKLCRPSQNSAHQYGYGLNINEVVELTKSSYREELIRAHRPDWDNAVSGLHTYARAGNLTTIDAMNRQGKILGKVQKYDE